MRKRKNDGSRLTIVLVVIAVLLCAAIFFAGGYLLMENRKETAKPTETPVSSVETGVHTMSGSVEDATMNTLDVKTEDGKVYSFSLQGVVLDTENGLLVGDTV